MEQLNIAVKEYLTEVLPIREVEIRPYAGVESLPYFLRDAYDVRELGLRGTRLLMAIQRAFSCSGQSALFAGLGS